MIACPNLRVRPDGVEWCVLAEAAVAALERTRDGIDQLLVTSGALEGIADRLAATCADPIAVADYLEWKDGGKVS